MINLKDAYISHIIVHRVGNKIRGEKNFHSNKELKISENDTLASYVINNVKKLNVDNCFYSDGKLQNNSVFSICDEIFEDENFIKASVSLAQQLYQSMRYSSIKGGNFIVAILEHIIFDGKFTKGIGLFKIDDFDIFYRVVEGKSSIGIVEEEGFGYKSPNEQCLILNLDFKGGYHVLMPEKSVQTQKTYWNDDFLSIRPRDDDYNRTRTFISSIQDFVEKDLGKHIALDKVEKLSIINDTINYFENHDSFSLNTFKDSVMANSTYHEMFEEYLESNSTEIMESNGESFVISKAAVKSVGKKFKRVVKLDKNFHVYIHADRSLFEKGIDENGRKYYKLFYDHEE
ncbi:MAG: nucleoid-associated protein [Bacteroidetes bacterium]|nr:nucleoid-associated protein [Bacteroidota bacterium]